MNTPSSWDTAYGDSSEVNQVRLGADEPAVQESPSGSLGLRLAQNVIDTVRDPMLVLDEHLSVRSANASFYKDFRVSPGDSVGRPVFELGNGQWDIPELRYLLGEVLPNSNAFEDYEVEHHFEEIGQRVMLLTGSKIADFDLVLLAIEDITERKQQEQTIRRAMEQAEKTLDTVREPMLVLGDDLRVRRANDAFYEDFRVSREETEGKLVYELGNGQWDIPRLRALLEEVLPHDHSFRDYWVEHEFPKIGHRSMLLNARRIDHVQLILLAIEDVTQRERDQDALRESEARLDRIVRQVPVGIGLLDDQGGWILRNPILQKMIPGVVTPSLDPVERGRWQAWTADGELLPQADWPGARALRGETTSPGMDFLHTQEDGSQRWIRVSAAPYRVYDNPVTGAVVVCEDITERKRTEEALRQTEFQLRAALAIKDDFLALVSHELRTPLTTITGFARQLVRRIDEMEAESRLDAVQQLHTSAVRLQVLIENMLILTQLERSPPEMEPMLLQRMLPVVVEAYREQHPFRRIDLSVQNTLPPVVGREAWIGQVVQNLISNADKYSPPGEPIHIKTESSGGEIIIRVLDRGVGIAESDQDQVFEPFFRSTKSTSQASGAGVGLAVCKRLVEIHGGSIIYRPRPGGGSIFEFTLPTIEAEEKT